MAEDGSSSRGGPDMQYKAGALSKREELLERLRSNLRLNGVWQEMSGSVGDLGIFLPLLLAMALVNGLDLGTTLVFTGIYNLVTGGLFGVPMPVQPMKSIAAVAITEGDPLTLPQIMAAGITTASLLLFLGITGLMTLVQRLVPLSVVRGIQLGQGISFGLTAVKYILKNQNLKKSKSTNDRPWAGSDGLLLALSAFVFVVLVTGAGGGAGSRKCGELVDESSMAQDEESAEGEQSLEEGPWKNSKPGGVQDIRARILGVIPSALIVFLVGVVIAIIRKPSVVRGLKFGPSHMSVVHISRHDWKTGFVRAAVPQIPLSILNSVIAVCKLSNDLFPEKRFVTPRTVSTSVGLMNLVGCWFGAMPVCHGAGGLAGQYRFGARTGLSVAILGTVKLLVGLFLGSSLLRLLGQFPIGLLGVLLFFSGLELAMACRDQTSRLNAFVMLVVTFVSLGSSNLTKGFCFGMVIWVLASFHELYIERRVLAKIREIYNEIRKLLNFKNQKAVISSH